MSGIRGERGQLTLIRHDSGEREVRVYTCEGEPVLKLYLSAGEAELVASGVPVRPDVQDLNWLFGRRELTLLADPSALFVQGSGGVDGRSAAVKIVLGSGPVRPPCAPGKLFTDRVRGRLGVPCKLYPSFSDGEGAAA